MKTDALEDTVGALRALRKRNGAPSGVSINHRGIAPDIELARDPKPPEVPVQANPPLEERDPDVKRAVQELKVKAANKSSLSASLRPR